MLCHWVCYAINHVTPNRLSPGLALMRSSNGPTRNQRYPYGSSATVWRPRASGTLCSGIAGSSRGVRCARDGQPHLAGLRGKIMDGDHGVFPPGRDDCQDMRGSRSYDLLIAPAELWTLLPEADEPLRTVQQRPRIRRCSATLTRWYPNGPSLTAGSTVFSAVEKPPCWSAVHCMGVRTALPFR